VEKQCVFWEVRREIVNILETGLILQRVNVYFSLSNSVRIFESHASHRIDLHGHDTRKKADIFQNKMLKKIVLYEELQIEWNLRTLHREELRHMCNFLVKDVMMSCTCRLGMGTMTYGNILERNLSRARHWDTWEKILTWILRNYREFIFELLREATIGFLEH
jgi:5-keto 4-deoxyuronate isomerase